MISTQFNFTLKPGGTVVKTDMFGVNCLIHRDNFTPSGNLPTTIEQVGASTVRYPGGTVTEDFFDLTNPNRTSGVGYFSGKFEKSLVPLQSFLSYAEHAGKKALIVLPTYRFFDLLSRDANASAKAEIQSFIFDLVSGKFGSAAIAGIEIGNEWYQERFQWTAAEFGRLQAKLATWIDEAAKRLGVDLPIFVQAGRGDDDGNGINDNVELSAAFNGTTIKAVDGLISHLYLATSTANPMILGSSIADRLASVEATWRQKFDRDFQQVVTEWNVGEDGPNNTTINGIMRSAPLVRLFATMIQAGVDSASIWTAQNSSPAALSGPQKGDGLLTPTGLLFRLLSSYLPNTVMQSIDESSVLKSASGSPVGYSFSFDGDGREVLVMSSGVAETVSISANIKATFDSRTHVFGMLLEGLDGTSGAMYRSGAQVSVVSLADLDGVVSHDGILQFTLAPFETIVIVVSNGVPVNIQADPQSAVSDVLLGTQLGDILSGFAGADTIYGFAGNDTISPGRGSDVVYGGEGDDTFLVEDHFVLVDGGSGLDTIDLSGFKGGVYVDPTGTIVSSGGSNVGTCGSIENLIGTKVDDRIYVPTGMSSVDGGDGDDFIFVLTSGDHKILAGCGDDFIFSKTDGDTIYGGLGSDQVSAFGDRCLIDGGFGDDTVSVWGNFVRVRDSEGNDTFHFNESFGLTADFSSAAGSNIVYGFNPDLQRLILSEGQWQDALVTTGTGPDGSASLSIVGDGFSILLVGVSELPRSFFLPDVAYWM
jgi:Ca2+-binding RTX toxin-like protein